MAQLREHVAEMVLKLEDYRLKLGKNIEEQRRLVTIVAEQNEKINRLRSGNITKIMYVKDE